MGELKVFKWLQDLTLTVEMTVQKIREAINL
jgi:hypothetical protein